MGPADQYLTGPEGHDRPGPRAASPTRRAGRAGAAGKEVLVDGAAYAKPWSFIPGFSSASTTRSTTRCRPRSRRRAAIRRRSSRRPSRPPRPPWRSKRALAVRVGFAGPGRCLLMAGPMAVTARPSERPAARADRAASRDARRLRAHRDPDVLLPDPEDRGDRLRRLSSASVDWGLRGPRKFVGSTTTSDPDQRPVFHKAISNTIYYAVVWVPLTMALGLFLAVIVNQKIRGQTFFRAAFYFPAIASSAAITMLWIFLFQPDGLFNEVRGGARAQPAVRGCFGYRRRTRTGSATSDTALNTIIVLNVWTTSGHVHAVLPGLLQTISNDVYEAAAIDGASAWQTFRQHHLPAAAAGPLLRGHGGGHRRAPAVRPGVHRRRRRTATRTTR